MTYMARRYRYKDGKLEKNFDGDQDGWFKTKEAALEAATAPKVAPIPDAAPSAEEKPKRGRRRKEAIA